MVWMRKCLSVATFSAFAGISAYAPCGHSSHAATDGAETLVVSCVSVEPWGFEALDTGAHCGYLAFLAKKAGLDVISHVRPIGRLVAGLGDGSVDIAMVVPSPERDKLGFEICRPTHFQADVAYLKAILAPHQVSDFANKSFGMIKGSTVYDSFFEAGARRVNIKSMTQGFMMLALHRVDATFCVQPGCQMAARKAGIDNSQLGFFPVSDFPVSVMISRRSPLMQDNDAIDRLRTICLSDESKIELDNQINKYLDY